MPTIRDIPTVNTFLLRPLLSTQDKTYYNTGIQVFDSMTRGDWYPGKPTQVVLNQTLQEFVANPPDNYLPENRHLLMTDCHYYFDDYDFTNKKLGMVYTVGNRFAKVPGKY